MKMNLKFATIAAALAAAAGCFYEPESADRTVPAGNRIYSKDGTMTEVDAALFGATPASVDYLNLDRNQLTNVAAVASLTGLKWLRLNGNRLDALPDLKSCAKLRRIYLRNNRFSAVPETLKDLPELTDIDLSGNPVKELPEWLMRKTGLKNLSFSRTQLERLPEDLSAWRTLQSLQLGDLRLGKDEMARIRAALPDVRIVF